MSIVYNGNKDSRQFKDVIAKTISELIEKDENVVWLDADLMGCSGTLSCLGTNDRYINCGIAEANMIGIAAGLSASGMKPFAHTFGPFASRRVFDQVFLAGAYAKNPMTIIGTDPGITAAYNGGTHMPFEDMALYRSIPESTVIDISDAPTLSWFMKEAINMPGVKYIRVPRKDSVQIYSDDHDFKVGKGEVLVEGNDGVIIASGIMVAEALVAATNLEKEGIKVAVIDPVTVKPLDVELIRSYAEKTGKVVVCNNHNKIGGLVEAVSFAIAGIKCDFSYVAVEDEFGEVGAVPYLRERFNLTNDHIEDIFKSWYK